MESRKSILCHYDMVRFITETDLINAVGEGGVISACIGKRTEIMMFLGKALNGENYEVRVYKFKSSDSYVPRAQDGVLRYSETEEYTSLFFDTFEKGALFIENWTNHHEYKIRPARERVICKRKNDS